VPFVSKAQQRFAFATHQPWAKEWADKTTFKNLPQHVGRAGKQGRNGPGTGGGRFQGYVASPVLRERQGRDG